MAANAARAAGFLKSLAHEGRLMILCHLEGGERSVSELEALLDTRQAAVSQMLARLREDGLVRARREGKVVYYSLSDQASSEVIALLYRLFCAPDSPSKD
ncbi:ArsR/SmtB family transcription factor [Pseudooceanicola aestuarii]|uniref:ArsR/SmtB family transcription factor n=1 Tax=Pseudooceanicola aestuarii TaxID=2697319 RepID=UPI0013CF65F4|nr:metalloregulator ArsR/SmtB family transcription factor [Pseudooceanicola aestuarii]